ncbi:MAG: pyridoxal-phosphate dependent enzyme, partial [Propionibacteriaceae bacterium]|nr:pyridoxal-phosphate dependent enzyme [Propionibacteriaceae bacterium]
MSALQGALHTRTCLDMIGETPLLKLGRIGSLPDGVSVLAKAEHLNPSGSVKDRAVRAMILQGLDSQELTLGK